MSAAIAAGTPRRATHAGSFYPADPAALDRQVTGLLTAARRDRSPDTPLPLGLLVPHAGLDWSGPVAARGWVELEPRGREPQPRPNMEAAPLTVVLAGTNHFARRPGGVAVWPGGPWRTPLGEIAIDEELRTRILALGEPFAARAEPHLGEHSIEVELPFVARASPGARLVPLLVGPLGVDACRAAGAALGRLLAAARSAGGAIVVAASSDLAHYPARAVAERVDAESLAAIASLDADRLARHEATAEAGHAAGLDCALCGIEPALFTLAAVKEMGASQGTVLTHATSADAPGGDPRRVVGYAAVRFD